MEQITLSGSQALRLSGSQALSILLEVVSVSASQLLHLINRCCSKVFHGALEDVHRSLVECHRAPRSRPSSAVECHGTTVEVPQPINPTTKLRWNSSAFRWKPTEHLGRDPALRWTSSVARWNTSTLRWNAFNAVTLRF
jgi:hypothetical protein